MIIACIIAYNEERMLPGCLEELQGQVDRIVVVDGAVAQFRHQVAASTDATEAIARAYGVEWILCPEDLDGNPIPWESEVEKRCAYLLGEEGDWYLVIDADERLTGVLPTLEDGRHYAIGIFSPGECLAWGVRLFQHRGHMRYEGSHIAIWSDDRLMRLAEATRIDAARCHLTHLARLREVHRQVERRRYHEWQRAADRNYRIAHGI